MISIPSIFFRPSDRAEEADAARDKFFVPESDHLTFLHVFQQWKASGYSAEWCKEHFLHVKAMRKVREVRQQVNIITISYTTCTYTCIKSHP
jgi:pre-mRNA-splicing factor ATP-dependent RNA helicase DHX38/PRP16